MPKGRYREAYLPRSGILACRRHLQLGCSKTFRRLLDLSNNRHRKGRIESAFRHLFDCGTCYRRRVVSVHFELAPGVKPPQPASRRRSRGPGPRPRASDVSGVYPRSRLFSGGLSDVDLDLNARGK
jgi:hypothetical protein